MSNKLTIVAFDMDGTLLQGRLVLQMAKISGTEDRVRYIMNNSMIGYARSVAIAKLWKGLSKDMILEALSSIELSDNAVSTITELKRRGCIVGIISDSYTLATDYIAGMLGMHFSIANRLEYDSRGILTGNIYMPLGWQYIGCGCLNSVCKRYQLTRVKRMYRAERSVAVGDSRNDICMLSVADVSIAYNATDGIDKISMYSIDDLHSIIDILRDEGLIE